MTGRIGPIGSITHFAASFGWIGLSALAASLYFAVGTIVSFVGGDIDVALGGLLLTLLTLAIALWRKSQVIRDT